MRWRAVLSTDSRRLLHRKTKPKQDAGKDSHQSCSSATTAQLTGTTAAFPVPMSPGSRFTGPLSCFLMMMPGTPHWLTVLLGRGGGGRRKKGRDHRMIMTVWKRIIRMARRDQLVWDHGYKTSSCGDSEFDKQVTVLNILVNKTSNKRTGCSTAENSSCSYFMVEGFPFRVHKRGSV